MKQLVLVTCVALSMACKRAPDMEHDIAATRTVADPPGPVTLVALTPPSATPTALTTGTIALQPTATAPAPIATAATATATTAQGVAIPRTLWMERMRAIMPGKVCAAPFFAQCFTVPSATCESLVAELTASCIHDIEQTLPAQIDTKTGATYGRTVGQCVGSSYEVRQRRQGNFVNSPECNDVTRWQ